MGVLGVRSCGPQTTGGVVLLVHYSYVEAKGSTSDPNSNITYGSNFKITVTKSNKTTCTRKHIYNWKICNSWHMFNCKKLLKLQIRLPSLILLITKTQKGWIFPNQSWEVRNPLTTTIIITLMWIYLWCSSLEQISCNRWLYIKIKSIGKICVVHSVEQKSIGLKFSKSRTGSHVTYSCHHNSSRFTFPIFAHSWRFSVFHSLQPITPLIY